RPGGWAVDDRRELSLALDKPYVSLLDPAGNVIAAPISAQIILASLLASSRTGIPLDLVLRIPCSRNAAALVANDSDPDRTREIIRVGEMQPETRRFCDDRPCSHSQWVFSLCQVR